jgi:hypothetical protein
MPDEIITDTGIGVEHSSAEDAAFLAEGDKVEDKVKRLIKGEDEKEVKEPEEEPEKEEEAKEELEEVEEEKEEEEPDETKDQIKTRPAFKAITAEYPDFFKKFPDMREMYFREQAYTKEFPTVEDAQEARETVERFNNLDEMVSAGTIEGSQDFLKSIKESDDSIHKNFALNFLGALAKNDRDLHYQVLTPVAQDFIAQVFSEGSKLGEAEGKNLRNAALVFAQYYFNDLDIAKGKKTAVKVEAKNEEAEKLQREREAFYAEKYEAAEATVNTSIRATLNREITKALDPKGDTFNSFLLKTLTKETLTAVDLAISKDTQYTSRMSSLWKQARKLGYSKESTDRLVSAYLSRARQLLPEIRNKIRSEALSGKSEEKSTHSRRDISGGGQQRFSRDVVDPKKIDYSKTSDRDILDGRVTTRK